MSLTYWHRVHELSNVVLFCQCCLHMEGFGSTCFPPSHFLGVPDLTWLPYSLNFQEKKIHSNSSITMIKITLIILDIIFIIMLTKPILIKIYIKKSFQKIQGINVRHHVGLVLDPFRTLYLWSPLYVYKLIN